MIVGIGFPTKTKGTAQGLFRGSVHEAFHEAFELEMERGAGRGEGHAHRAAGVQGGTEGGAGTPAHKGRHRSQGRGEASERRRGQPASPTEKNSDRREFVEKLVEMEVAVRCRRDHPPPPWGAAVGRPAVVATRPIVTGVDEAELRQAPQRYLRLHR